MKLFILVFSVLILSTPVFACRNKVPKSEAVRYIDAAPLGVPALYSCADKPEEPCLCFDEIDGWDVTKIGAGDSGEDILVNDPDKVAAKAARLQAEADAVRALETRRQAAQAALEVLDPNTIDTMTSTQMRPVLKAILKRLKEK